jgi:two-component system response regulator
MDDDPDDIEMLQEAILSINPSYRLFEASDGKEGLKLLHEMKQSASLPCLIVLDINMLGLDGRETFLQLKKDKVLSTIPVVIFSTSNSPMDKLFFQGRNAEYITKPIQYNRLLDVARRLLAYCEDIERRA